MLYMNRVYRHTLPIHVIDIRVQLPRFLNLDVSSFEQTVFDAGGMQVVPHPERPSCRAKSSARTWTRCVPRDSHRGKGNLRNFPLMPRSRSNEKEFSHWNPNLEYSVVMLRRPTWSGIRTSGAFFAPQIPPTL